MELPRSMGTPSLHHSWSPALSAALFPLISFLLLPLAALLLVEYSLVCALLFLGQALLALAALEWVWLMFRVRQRLLLALDADEERGDRQDEEQGDDEGQDEQEEEEEEGDEDEDADLEAVVPGRKPRRGPGDDLLLTVEDPRAPLAPGSDRRRRRRRRPRPMTTTVTTTPSTYALRLAEAQRATTFAMERPARWRCFCGCWFVPALLLSFLAAGVGVALAYWLADDALSTTDNAWVMTVAATCEAAVVSIWCGALAPTPGDAFVMVVYQATVLAAAMNAYLRYRVDLLDDNDLVDSLYISLVGACATIVFRVISSRRVMASLLLVLGDVLGLLCLAAPLVTVADAIDRAPVTDQYRQQLALFILVVTATDVGDALAHALPSSVGLPLCGKRSGTSLAAKSERTRRDVDAAIVAWSCAALTLGVARVVMGVSVFNAVEVLVLLFAVGVGQWARLWIVAVKQMANVTTTAFYLADKSRAAGALERVALFMVAVLVYYPYVKDRFITNSIASGSGSGSSSESLGVGR